MTRSLRSRSEGGGEATPPRSGVGKIAQHVDRNGRMFKFSLLRAVTNSQCRSIEFTGGNPRTTVRRKFGVVPRISADVEHAFRANTGQNLAHDMLLFLPVARRQIGLEVTLVGSP